MSRRNKGGLSEGILEGILVEIPKGFLGELPRDIRKITSEGFFAEISDAMPKKESLPEFLEKKNP